MSPRIQFDINTSTTTVWLGDTMIAVKFNSPRQAAMQKMCGVDPLVHWLQNGGDETLVASGITAATIDEQGKQKWTPDRVLRKLDEEKQRDDGTPTKYIVRGIMLAYVMNLDKVTRTRVMESAPEMLALTEEDEEAMRNPAPVQPTGPQAAPPLPHGYRSSFMGGDQPVMPFEMPLPPPTANLTND